MSKNIEICKAEEVGAQVLDELAKDISSVQERAKQYGISIASPDPSTAKITELRALLSVFASKVMDVFNSFIAGLQSSVASLQATIVTLNASIAAYVAQIADMNSDIADAYDAVEDKGGTLPEEQTSANLPTAIESIPSGGAPDGFEYLDANGESLHEDILISQSSWRSKLKTIKDSITTSLSYTTNNITYFRAFAACNNLVSAEFQELITAPQCLFRNCKNLSTVVAPKCTNLLSIASGWERCSTIEEINAPSATTLGNAPQCLYANSKLRRIYCPKVSTVSLRYSAAFGYCDNCIDLEFGAYVTTDIHLELYNPSNGLLTNNNTLVTDTEDEFGNPITNNLQQFLYNLRRHIAANLPTRTSSTSLNIAFHANVKAAILADTATANAFSSKYWNVI